MHQDDRSHPHDDQPTWDPHQAGSEAPPSSQFPYPIQSRYRCIELIGQGGSGAVYRAYDDKLHRDVAIKFIHRQSHTEHSRLLNEGRVLAQLEHPNICRVYAVEEEGDALYLVMSYIDGRHLNQWRHQFNSAQLIQIIANIAHALDSAHQRGIVHCDVKPANIVLQDAPGAPIKAVLVDFGVAHSSHGNDTDSAAGTQYYMAPERSLSPAKALHPSIDIYSLGACLRLLLTGSHQSHLGKLPKDLRFIIEKCMQQDPRKRYLSALQLHDDLHAYLNYQPISLRRSPLYRTRRLWQRSPWFRGTLLAGAGMATVLGVVVSLYQASLHEQQLQQIKLSEQVVQGDYQVESIYRSPIHNVYPALQALQADAKHWSTEAASHPDWLAASHYAAAGRLFYQLYENEAALSNLQRAWALGDRSDRTAVTYAQTLKRFNFMAKRQARTLPNEEARLDAVAAADDYYASRALQVLQQAEQPQLPSDYLAATRLYFAGQPKQALRILQQGRFPSWFYQRYELMLSIADELLHDVLDGYSDLDEQLLLELHTESFQHLIAQVPSFQVAYGMRVELYLALLATRENEHPADTESWLDAVPQHLATMAVLDNQHPDYLVNHGRYHSMLTNRGHLSRHQQPLLHLQKASRYLEQGLRQANLRGWSEERRVKGILSTLNHYSTFITYQTNVAIRTEPTLHRYRTILDSLPDAYRGGGFYMSLGNAYRTLAGNASTRPEQQAYFVRADQAYMAARQRAPESIAIQANHARVLNGWASYQAIEDSLETRQRALNAITPVAEAAPNNVAILYNLGRPLIDQGAALAQLGHSDKAADLLDQARITFERIIDLAPNLSIARQQLADLYLFFYTYLDVELDAESRLLLVDEVLDLESASEQEAEMAHKRVAERWQQAYEAAPTQATKEAIYALAFEHVPNHQTLLAKPAAGRALTLVALDLPQPAQREWLEQAVYLLEYRNMTELTTTNVQMSANVISYRLARWQMAQESDIDARRQALQRACAESIDLFERGYLVDIHYLTAARAWRLVEAHAALPCRPTIRVTATADE
jgi:tRNA A-37 threonylcarbamoyl transferase component Bud32